MGFGGGGSKASVYTDVEPEIGPLVDCSPQTLNLMSVACAFGGGQMKGFPKTRGTFLSFPQSFPYNRGPLDSAN